MKFPKLFSSMLGGLFPQIGSTASKLKPSPKTSAVTPEDIQLFKYRARRNRRKKIARASRKRNRA